MRTSFSFGFASLAEQVDSLRSFKSVRAADVTRLARDEFAPQFRLNAFTMFEKENRQETAHNPQKLTTIQGYT